MATEKLPSRIGRYEIREELGRGMMGVVYEAYDPSLHRTIALKVIRLVFAASDAEQESFERRFLSEARIAARLSHPGIVVVHDIGRDPDTHILYIALERLRGRTLAQMTAEGTRLRWREALRIVARVAEALHYAHAQGVIHRDIKPANVMVLPSGDPKIMDFGLAKHEAGHEMTGSGQFVGTPLFMAPEQVLGQPVDGRTDLFSLGSVTYTLVTGVRPFAADSVPRIMARVAHQEPPPPSTVVPELPPVLDYLVARAMAKVPADRYANGAAMAEDVEDILAGRAPRHQGGWTAPAGAEGTLVAARKGEASSILELELEPVAQPQPPAAALPGEAGPSPALPVRPRRGSPLRTLTLGMLLAGLVALYLSINLPPPLREPTRVAPPLPRLTPSSPAAASTPLAVAPSPAAHQAPGAPASGKAPAGAPNVELTPPASPAPAATPTPAASPPLPPAASPGSSAAEAPRPESSPETPAAEIPQSAAETLASAPSPTPSPSGRPEALPTAKKAPTAAANSMGQLAIHMEHHLKSGRVRVFLDGKLVLQDDLDARVSRKILFFSLRKGLVQEVLKVSPGRHELRVEVKWDDSAEAKRITGTFKPGVTRHLEIGVSRIGGNLSLEWQ